MEKVGIVITVLNEEDSIGLLLRSITEQSQLPDEVVFVDAGSDDGTVEALTKWSSQQKFAVQVLHKSGYRSVGRNYGISQAKNDLIAITDAGCTLHEDWLKRITEPFSQDEDIMYVSGFYTPTGDTAFQKALGAYTSVMPDRLDPETYLPSSRSLALRKQAWEKVDGYPEHLNTAEDLVFARKLQGSDMKHVTVADAIVYWPQKKTFTEAFKQFYAYAHGDGKALYIRRQTPFLFGRYGVGLVLVLLGWWRFITFALLMYVVWAILKNYTYVREKKALYILPALQFTADFAVMAGMIHGLLDRIKMKAHSQKSSA